MGLVMHRHAVRMPRIATTAPGAIAAGGRNRASSRLQLLLRHVLQEGRFGGEVVG